MVQNWDDEDEQLAAKEGHEESINYPHQDFDDDIYEDNCLTNNSLTTILLKVVKYLYFCTLYAYTSLSLIRVPTKFFFSHRCL